MERRIYWITGLQGSGKTTTAVALQKHLEMFGQRVKILDGDDIRQGLSSDLGFSLDERHENIRRVAHVAAMFWNEGYTVICSFISPTEKIRNMAKALIEKLAAPTVEMVYLDTPIEVCQERDTKGMYKDNPKFFTGVSQSYQVPLSPAFTFDTSKLSPNEIVEALLMPADKAELPEPEYNL